MSSTVSSNPIRSASADEPQVSVLVINYNGIAFLEPLMRSLKTAFERLSSEVIVVDNASTDGSAEWLRRQPGIRLIALGINTGFTGGNNIGAEHARGRVLLLINADTEVRGPLDGLVEAASRSDVGAAGCQLRYADGRLQYSVGLEHGVARIALSWLGFERRSGVPSLFRKFETDAAFYAAPRSGVDWVSGACMATRREVWDRLGGFDPAFFMYCEDVDYCHRARRSGLQIVYLPDPVVTHHEGGGKAWIGSAALLRTARAYQVYTAKTHGPVAARILCSLLAVIFALRSAAFAMREGRWPARADAELGDGRAHAYWRAARRLFAAALTGRTQVSV